LGGQVRLVTALGSRGEFARILGFLERELARLDVDVHVGSHADAETVAAADPDAVIVATGSLSAAPGPASEAGPRLLVPEALARELSSLGRRVVVCDRGTSHDRLLAVAEAALGEGRKLYVVTPRPALGDDISFISRAGILRRLRAGGAHLLVLTHLRLQGSSLVELREVGKGAAGVLHEVDTVVMVTPSRPERTLLDELDGKVPRLLPVGDCVTPRGLAEAFREGRAAGLAV
jgi:hypothetical protein